ncbi:KTSC domain-containing protein [Paraburkholderia bryophila]|uniref:KTSC domain-containing protein n=1 Tax=Paraburkholderia bryophila TaxID=420952 RepID=UPI0023495986|nr:KTSC domain-containing protein [Paraburkholderia bryophila]WCM21424.1 KTSC domain-containing protein [Paraburkholderia bryophila]
MTTQITMDSVESSQIHAVGYDAATQTLAVQFKSKSGIGSTYHYSNFTPEDFAAFKAAESIGSHFYREIKPAKDKYPYVKVEPVPVVTEEQE